MIYHIKSTLRRIIRRPLHKATACRPYVFLGTEYGGWPLLTDTKPGSLIYSFGVGEDISFDLGAIQTFGCEVHAFDPTPKSIKWIAQQSLPDNFSFYPEGVAAMDGEAEFAPPANDAHVSYSSTREFAGIGTNLVRAPVRRIQSFIERIATGQPYIIKMDIEGFEYEVIEDMILCQLMPRQLLVEFHHNLYGFCDSDTRRSVKALIEADYEIFFVSISGREYGFCR